MEKFKASEWGFRQIRQALQETQEVTGWAIESYEWLKYAAKLNDSSWKENEDYPKGFSLPTWRRFVSRKNGQPVAINAKAFKIFCKVLGLDWEDIVDKNSSLTPKDDLLANFIGYDHTWVGRKNTIENLKQKIRGSSRILILNGITGIGKTALAEKLYKELEVEKKWNKLLRVNFDNQNQLDFGNFVTVAKRWLEECELLVTPDVLQDIPKLQKMLLDYLQQNHCLIIIDSLEWILKGNQEQGWSEFKDNEWAIFLRLFLSQLQCNSRIIITTQHLPKDVSSGYDNFWFCEEVRGLNTSEQLELFRKIGIKTQLDEEVDYLKRIGDVYEGHTLALKVVAATIKTVYQRNVTAYWKEEGEEIKKVELDLKLSQENKTTQNNWQIHQSNRDLYHKVYGRIDKTFERLKQYNYHSYLLICLASTYLSPHPKEDWLEHLADEGCSEKEQSIAFKILREEQLIESLIQENNRLFRLHNLIRSVAYEKFQSLD